VGLGVVGQRRTESPIAVVGIQRSAEEDGTPLVPLNEAVG